MGVEGRDRAKAMEAGASALSGQLGRTVQRLRKAYNLSLSELSEQSGVAKSIISQIERNETNPTLSTIRWNGCNGMTSMPNPVAFWNQIRISAAPSNASPCLKANSKSKLQGSSRRRAPARHCVTGATGSM